MTPAATAEKPPEAPEATDLGSLSLFASEDYKVKSLKAVLGAVNVDVDTNHPLYGLVVGDDVDLVLRGSIVTGAKSTHKGEVTLILTADDIDVLKPNGLPPHLKAVDGEEEAEEG